MPRKYLSSRQRFIIYLWHGRCCAWSLVERSDMLLSLSCSRGRSNGARAHRCGRRDAESHGRGTCSMFNVQRSTLRHKDGIALPPGLLDIYELYSCRACVLSIGARSSTRCSFARAIYYGSGPNWYVYTYLLEQHPLHHRPRYGLAPTNASVTEASHLNHRIYGQRTEVRIEARRSNV